MVESQGKVSKKSGNVEMDIERQPCLCCMVHEKHIYETRHDISNNVMCATSKGSDQPAHTRSLIRTFASRLSIL